MKYSRKLISFLLAVSMMLPGTSTIYAEDEEYPEAPADEIVETEDGTSEEEAEEIEYIVGEDETSAEEAEPADEAGAKDQASPDQAQPDLSEPEENALPEEYAEPEEGEGAEEEYIESEIYYADDPDLSKPQHRSLRMDTMKLFSKDITG